MVDLMRPETKKNTEDQIPAPTVKRGPERETMRSISQETAMIPQMIWAMPSTVVALALNFSLFCN